MLGLLSALVACIVSLVAAVLCTYTTIANINNEVVTGIVMIAINTFLLGILLSIIYNKFKED